MLCLACVLPGLPCHARAGPGHRSKGWGGAGGVVRKSEKFGSLLLAHFFCFQVFNNIAVSIGVSISLRKKYMTLGRLLQERAIWLLL